jgi:hypothetical protein
VARPQSISYFFFLPVLLVACQLSRLGGSWMTVYHPLCAARVKIYITRAWLFAGSKNLALLKRRPHDQVNLGCDASNEQGWEKGKTQAPSSKHEHGQSPPSVSASFSRQIRPEIKTRQPRKSYTSRPLPGNRFNRSNHPPTRPGTRSNVGTTVRVSQ